MRGLDPRIHLLCKKSYEDGWIAGSSPAMTIRISLRICASSCEVNSARPRLGLLPPRLRGSGGEGGSLLSGEAHDDDWRSQAEITRHTAPLSRGIGPPRPCRQAAPMVSLRQDRNGGRARCLRALLGTPELEPLASNDDAETHCILPQLQCCPCSWPSSREKGTTRLLDAARRRRGWNRLRTMAASAATLIAPKPRSRLALAGEAATTSLSQYSAISVIESSCD
jgi:hypothetical protein